MEIEKLSKKWVAAYSSDKNRQAFLLTPLLTYNIFQNKQDAHSVFYGILCVATGPLHCGIFRVLS